MKAIVLHGKREVRVSDFPVKEVGAGDVKIAVAYCGICGTDLHKVEGKAGSRPVTYPVPLGHEISGYVEEVGSDVSGFKVGDAVTVDPNWSCGKCYYCKEGKPSFCENARGVVKGMAEYVVAPAENVYPLPENMDMKLAALAEPLACCLRGADLLDVSLGETVALIGFGSIGMMMFQLLKYRGASNIIVVETNMEKKAIAEDMGATAFVSPLDADAMAEVKKKYHMSRVIECVGNSAAQKTAIDLADKGATVVLFGVSSAEDKLSLSVYDAFLKELTIKTSYVNPHTTGRAIALLASGLIDTKHIFAKVMEPEEAVAELLQPSYCRNGKVLVRISGERA